MVGNLCFLLFWDTDFDKSTRNRGLDCLAGNEVDMGSRDPVIYELRALVYLSLQSCLRMMVGLRLLTSSPYSSLGARWFSVSIRAACRTLMMPSMWHVKVKQ